MEPATSPQAPERDLKETHGGLATALKVFWAICFLAIGVLTTVRVLDTSTSVDVPCGSLRSEDGSWSLESVEAVCRQALAEHGVDPATSRPLNYIPGQRLGSNASRPNRILSAWEVAEDGRRVTVYIDVEGSVARCKVSESK